MGRTSSEGGASTQDRNDLVDCKPVTETKAPRISSFTPAMGRVGTLVTISGSNFAGVTSVKFGTRVSAFTVVSATQIKATVPSGATTGKITVTNGAGSATSATNFTVIK